MMSTFAAIFGDTSQGSRNTLHDSYNQLPVWQGKKDSVRSVLPVANSIRKGHWKLIIGMELKGLHRHLGAYKHLKNTKGELYNLKSDVSETKNLYNKYPQKVKRLK